MIIKDPDTTYTTPAPTLLRSPETGGGGGGGGGSSPCRVLPQTLHDNQRSRHHLYHTSTNPTPIPRNRGGGGGRVLPQTLHDNQRSRHHLYHTSTNPTPIPRNRGGGGGHLPAVFFHRHCMIIKDPDTTYTTPAPTLLRSPETGGGGCHLPAAFFHRHCMIIKDPGTIYTTPAPTHPNSQKLGGGGGGSSPCRVLPQTLHDNQRSRHHLYYTSTNPSQFPETGGGGGVSSPCRVLLCPSSCTDTA